MIKTPKIPDTGVSNQQGDPQADRTLPLLRNSNGYDSGEEAWRLIGIMAEFATATERLRHVTPAVSIFGSARLPPEHPYCRKTEVIARKLSDAGFSVISGGGPGIMEAANRGAFPGRSSAVGLNILLPHEQRSNDFQDVSLNFRYFFARKMMFVRFASAYVVLPGGFGTLDELTECMTLVQTGKARRIPIILVGGEFWRGFLDWMRGPMVEWGMASPEELDLLQIIEEPDDIVKAIFDFYEAGFKPSPEEREKMLHL
ncbi:MAG: TIGR00730 family Rossman fold protein [Burkholderiales bacterium]|jgi:uncharacterized protein (TIGR00730 family)|nr:TIGR00730 family Rossman fold protein [Burkholderiales bacterium]